MMVFEFGFGERATLFVILEIVLKTRWKKERKGKAPESSVQRAYAF